jgi:hypothetical protein
MGAVTIAESLELVYLVAKRDPRRSPASPAARCNWWRRVEIGRDDPCAGPWHRGLAPLAVTRTDGSL